MENIIIPRSGNQDLAFVGEAITDRYQMEVWAGRRYAGQMYRTQGGQYVAHIEYRTTWDGELDLDWAEYGTKEEVLAWLHAFDPMGPVHGFPHGVSNFNQKQGALEDRVTKGYAEIKQRLCRALGPEIIE